MLLSQEIRKENKLFTLKQLFDRLKQKEHRMSIFNVVTAINRVQISLYQSESSNSNHRNRENVRNRDKTRDSSRERDKRDNESQFNSSNQNDDNHSLQNIKGY